MNTKTRNSSFELLRIVSISFIVLSHLSWHGYADKDLVYSYIESPFNRDLLRCLNLGNLGVDIFVMISGYFLIHSTKVKFRKVLQLFALTWFYGVVISGIFTLSGIGGGILEVVKMATFPLTFGSSWFVTVYLILYSFHPFINNMLLNRHGEAHIKRTFYFILILCFVWWVFPYTFLLKKECYENPVITFFMLYLIGAYIRLYGKEIKSKYLILLFIILVGIWFLLPIMAELTGVRMVQDHVTYFYNTISLLTLLLASSIVLLFTRIHITSKKINFLATFVFPIYLISDNYWIRTSMYSQIFHCKDYADSPYLVLIIAGQALIIITVCVIIDLIRKYALLPMLDMSIKSLKNNIYGKLDYYTDKLFE